MSIQSDDVKKIAHLSRLAISATEEPSYIENLNRIFDLFESLKKIDTSDIEPMAHPLNITQRLRPDEAITLTAEEISDIQKIAPLIEAGLYLVPPVIE